MKGKFVVARDILFNPSLFQHRPAFILFIFLVGKAAFKDLNIGGIAVKKGQFLRSMRQLKSDLAFQETNGKAEYSLHTLHDAINLLCKLELIRAEKKGQKGTLFTVLHYAEMQVFREHLYGTPESTIKGTPQTEEEAAPGQHFEQFETDLGNTSKHHLGNTFREQKELMNYKELNIEEEEGPELNLFVLVEKYRHVINRPLTRTQIDMLGAALDDGIEITALDYLIGQAAKKDYPITYFNRVLADWHKNNIRTKEQAEQRQETLHGRKGAGGSGKNSPQVFDSGKNYGF